MYIRTLSVRAGSWGTRRSAWVAVGAPHEILADLGSKHFLLPAFALVRSSPCFEPMQAPWLYGQCFCMMQRKGLRDLRRRLLGWRGRHLETLCAPCRCRHHDHGLRRASQTHSNGQSFWTWEQRWREGVVLDNRVWYTYCLHVRANLTRLAQAYVHGLQGAQKRSNDRVWAQLPAHQRLVD